MLNLSSITKQQGITIVELLVALLISTFLLASILGFYILSVQNSKETLTMIRLNQELHMIMDVMENQIRRAGYWANATNDIGTGALTNPFMQPDTNIKISNNNECILFSYDENNDGALPALGTSDDERFGFRLSNNTVQFRMPSAKFNCDDTDTSWKEITDPKVTNINDLNFSESVETLSLLGGAKLAIRSITVTLTARLIDYPDIPPKTLVKEVLVYNNQFIPEIT